MLSGHEVVRAFADDTAAVVADYTTALPALQKLFSEFEAISGLALNISKTVFIPLWTATPSSNICTLLREVCPDWRRLKVDSKGKYLGFWIGPGAALRSWASPLEKYKRRSEQWALLHLGLALNARIHKVFLVSTLSFVMQLEPDPADLLDSFDYVTRRLAAGPGNWISRNDLYNLKAVYGLPYEFEHLSSLSQACKLRISATVARDAQERVWELERIQLQTFYRPLGAWHQRSFFTVLFENQQKLKEHGITVRSVQNAVGDAHPQSFQSVARQQILKASLPTYYCDSRVRAKLQRWRLPGNQGMLSKRALSNFKLLRAGVPPRVQVACFKVMWNGWVTSRRFNSISNHPNGCILGCGSIYGEDSVEHYACCDIFWSWACSARPGGLGIQTRMRSKLSFLLLHPDLSDEDRIRIALGVYAVHRLINHIRHNGVSASFQHKRYLSIMCKRGADGSKAASLLSY